MLSCWCALRIKFFITLSGLPSLHHLQKWHLMRTTSSEGVMSQKCVPTAKPHYQPFPGNLVSNFSSTHLHIPKCRLSLLIWLLRLCRCFYSTSKAICRCFSYNVPINSELNSMRNLAYPVPYKQQHICSRLCSPLCSENALPGFFWILQRLLQMLGTPSIFAGD